MDYHEIEPPPRLRHLVKVAWTLDAPAGRGWIRHNAMPDGCIEIIRRLEGRSRWGGEQPECFAAGLITAPARLEISRGARFVALRIWPWAWNALGLIPSPDLVNRWAALPDAAPGLMLPSGLDSVMAAFPTIALDPEAARLAAIIPSARSVEELVAASGWPARRLQRWFRRVVGVPPRLYLRLLRFEETLTGLKAKGSLADHAAARGFADQAHMAREFRAIAGASASRARKEAKGPFL
jgi:AraC-like DNA-binding protein